ncbi:hypothetical protein EOL26_18395 [Escherichia coli]|nr:hypothetical protein EOL26_18395 [Escherichia coli]
MHLKCPQCGSCNTLISSVGKLPSITDNKRSGYISLEFLPEILKEIIKAIKKLFGFLEQCERNNAPVLICMDCGYYERI